MKRILFSILTLFCVTGYAWSQECPPAATSTTTISFRRNNPSILPGAFSVSSTKQVNFTKGNLQYNAAYNSWRFAENQYTYIGNAAGNNVLTSARTTQNAWIDWFGWGTSGFDNTVIDATAVNFQPWAYVNTITGDANNPYQYGPSITIMAANASWSESLATKNYDWGVYNFTAGVEAGCRTLTKAEWTYLLATRTNATSLYGFGKLFGVNGIYLLPDSWSWSSSAVAAAVTAASFVWTAAAKVFTNNVIADDDNGRALWRAMEDAGAVFLPAAGCHNSTGIVNVGERGWYATSTCKDSANYYSIYFYPKTLNLDNNSYRSSKICVRLVKDVP